MENINIINYIYKYNEFDKLVRFLHNISITNRNRE